MRSFTIAGLIVAMAAVAAAGERKTAWEEDGLHGRVRTVRAVTETLGKPSEKSTRVTRYDADGRRLEWTRTDATGKQRDRTTYAYTQKGALAELRYFGPKNALQTRSTFVFDEKGQRTAISNFDPKGTLKDKTTSQYDAAGHETEATRVGADGAAVERVVYTPDAKGRVAEEKRYGPTGTLVERVVTQYDDHGFVSRQTTVDGAGATTAREAWTNDDDGNKVDWTVFNADGTVKEKWQYDYSFDKAGNWTKRTASKVVEKAGKTTTVPTVVTTRTIEYF